VGLTQLFVGFMLSEFPVGLSWFFFERSQGKHGVELARLIISFGVGPAQLFSWLPSWVFVWTLQAKGKRLCWAPAVNFFVSRRACAAFYWNFAMGVPCWPFAVFVFVLTVVSGGMFC
jgi:hypothetical protein